MNGQPQPAPTATMRPDFVVPSGQPRAGAGSFNFFGPTNIYGAVIAGDQLGVVADGAARGAAEYLFAVADVYSWWRNQYILGPASSSASPFITTDSATLVRQSAAADSADSGPVRRAVLDALTRLAAAMQAAGYHGTAVQHTWATDHLPDPAALFGGLPPPGNLRGDPRDHLLDFGCAATILDTTATRATVRFWHLAHQDYFSALAASAVPAGPLRPAADEVNSLAAALAPQPAVAIQAILLMQTGRSRFRLLPDSSLRYVSSNGAGVTFLLTAGRLFADHDAASGDIVIQSGNSAISALGTLFTVATSAGGAVVVSVQAGTVAVEVPQGSKQIRNVTQGQGMQIPAGATAPPLPQAMTPGELRLWQRIGPNLTLTP